MTAKDDSVIDSIGFGVAASGGGGAVGMAMAANVITNDVKALIVGSTVTAGMDVSNNVANNAADVTLEAISSAIIRTLALGVSASGDVAVQMTVLGNVVSNNVAAEITSNSMVFAGGTVSLLASDKAPNALTTWLVPVNSALS